MSRRSYNIDSPSTAAADALYHGRGPSMDERLRSGYTPPKKKVPYDVSGATSSNRALRRNQPQYDDDEEEERPPLAIPKINRDNLSEDDGLLSPRRISQQMGAFGSMLESGAGWGSAMIAALQGHQMTEEQAAICLQSHARRKSAENELTARKGEMAHMENEYREYQRYQMAAALRADIEREHWAASQINAGWRGHLDRQHVAKMRKEKKPVRRSFSWSSKKKNAKAAAPSAASQAPSAASSAALDELTSGSAPSNGGFGKRVRRSLSFGKKSSSSSGSSGSKDKPLSTSATRRTFVLERGPQGLGLELDAVNTVVTIKEGGRAERQGLLALGDTILSIDGKSCAGLLMSDIMEPGRAVYVVEVSRPERAAYAPETAKPKGLIKRSLSFDTSRRGGGVRRSFSFERKK